MKKGMAFVISLLLLAAAFGVASRRPAEATFVFAEGGAVSKPANIIQLLRELLG